MSQLGQFCECALYFAVHEADLYSWKYTFPHLNMRACAQEGAQVPVKDRLGPQKGYYLDTWIRVSVGGLRYLGASSS